jgi:ribosomal protein L14
VLVSAIGASPHSPNPDPTIDRRAAETLTAALFRLEPAPRRNDDSRISIEDYAVAVIDKAEQGRALGRHLTLAY